MGDVANKSPSGNTKEALYSYVAVVFPLLFFRNCSVGDIVQLVQ